MPPPIRRIVREDPELVLPERVAIALRPSADRSNVPPRFTLSATSQPYGGELREEQQCRVRSLAPNAQVCAVTLRRPWTFIAFAVDPGNVGAAGLSAILKVITNGVQGFLPAVAIASAIGPQAFPAQIIGARAELFILNKTAVTVTGIRVTLWGMSER